MKQQRIPTALATVLAAITTSTAFAQGHHQICYQGPSWNSQPTVVVHCRSDVPGVSCSVSLQATPAGYFPPAAGASTVESFRAQPGSVHTATIDFSDGSQRTCTTQVAPLHQGFGGAFTRMAATVPLLIGFTTDQSGLLTTGIWSSQTTNPERVQHNVIAVPWDFVLVGGGALGSNYPSGALISKMAPDGDSQNREWRVLTQDALVAQPHDNESFAIGMKIEGVTIANLRNLVAWKSAGSDASNPNGMPHPTAQVRALNGFPAILGGGVKAYAYASPQTGQFLTASSAIPAGYGNCLWWGGGFRCESIGATGWYAASKDHGVSAPGGMNVLLSSMPDTISVNTPAGPRNFRVETFAMGLTSGVAAHPSIVVGGRSGEFALTGVGAAVDWQSHGPYGNLLWKVVPRADIAGVEASSKDHAYSSPATITGYVLGVKLVP
jgi:hypothetical protein